jgi:hypothetical protein
MDLCHGRPPGAVPPGQSVGEAVAEVEGHFGVDEEAR